MILSSKKREKRKTVTMVILKGRTILTNLVNRANKKKEFTLRSRLALKVGFHAGENILRKVSNQIH